MGLRDYIKKTWTNSSSPAINATNLQYIDNKIDELDKYLVPRLILKSADETVNNSGVYQNDNQLVVALTGGKIYQVELFVRGIAAHAENDIKFKWVYSGTAAYNYRFAMGNGYSETYPIDGKVCLNSMSALSDDSIVQLDTTFYSNIQEKVLISCTTSGNLQLMWAQYGVSANNTTVSSGSHMLVREVVAY